MAGERRSLDNAGTAMTRGARRLARALAVLAALGAFAIPLTESVAWALLARGSRLPAGETGGDGGSSMMLAAARDWGVPGDPSLLTTEALLAGWIIALVAAAPTMFGLWSVRRTFLESAEGRPFSAASVRGFRRFAWASLAAVLVAVIRVSATGAVLSVLSPEIQNQLSVGLGSQDISRLFSALLFVAVARMFAVAKRNAEDVEGLL
jgi:hypothetical protein